MAVGDLVTEFYQYEYAGLAFGPETPYSVIEVSGLIGYPAVRRTTTDRFGQHGGVPSRHFLPAREFIVKLDFAAASDNEFGEYRKELMRALQPRTLPTEEEPFVFWHPGGEKLQIDARPVDLSFPIDRRFALQYPELAVRFEATTPFHVSNVEYTAAVMLVSDNTGLTFPLTFPLNFGASITNEVTLVNNGTAPAQWTAELTGAVTGPRLERVDTGEILHLPSLTVEAGETLVFNTKDRSIKLNGVSNRRSALLSSSRWFTIDPESSITVRYSASGAFSGSPTAIFSWRDTYWGES